MRTAYEQHDQDKLIGPSAMPVRATLRSSLRDPDLGISLYSAGAAPSRILFKRLFCARLFVIVLLVLLLRLVIVLLVLVLQLGLLYCWY